MRSIVLVKHVLFILLWMALSLEAKQKLPPAAVTDITDIQMFKKLMKSKINILVLFVNEPKSSQKVIKAVKETAEQMRGQATLVVIDCNRDKKKLCKKLKVGTDQPYYLKHYKDGEFHKDYDRNTSVASISNFLKDPTGDLPWEEDPSATDIYHLADGPALTKFHKRNAPGFKKSIIMFYAPWCGYCKVLKPEFVAAAQDLKGSAALGAIDVSRGVNAKVRQIYNITGFPTLLYFEKGVYQFPYNGEYKRDALLEFIKDPLAFNEKKKEKVDGSWSEDGDVVHLNDVNFDNILATSEHALICFYAPWCGHCKKLKPHFEKAATRLKSEGVNGILGAVDVTEYPELGTRFDVKGFPTLKYFKNGEYKFDSNARQEDQFVDFIKDPQPPPPPPPPETPWADEVSAVRHLDTESFRNTLRKIKHALVMFYAPWCGHCKTTKPEFVKAANYYEDELLIGFGAVDCTADAELCASHGVRGYPTIKYFSHFDRVVADYSGGRKVRDFISYIHSYMSEHQTQQKAPTNQEAGYGVNVQVVSDENFMSLIGSSYSLVMYYAPWCSFCVTAKPIYSKLATAVKAENLPLKVMAIDAAGNPKAADFSAIEILPTYKLYNSGKLAADYTGDRSFEDLLKFCKENVQVKDEL